MIKRSPDSSLLPAAPVPGSPMKPSRPNPYAPHGRAVRKALLPLAGWIAVGSLLPEAISDDRGLDKVITGSRVFVAPPDTPEGKTWLDQVAFPFQVSEDKAALLCNIREAYVKGLDYEVGLDVKRASAVAGLSEAGPDAQTTPDRGQ